MTSHNVQTIPIEKKRNQVVSTGKSPTTFTDMQKGMEEELERRRSEWEKEVEKMQMDFFNLKPTATEDGKTVDVEVLPSRVKARVPGSEIIDISNTKNLYCEKPDGTRVYRLRFDVRGFEPQEINVRAEGTSLSVQAKHEEEQANGRMTTKHFNRQMDIPDNVDPDKLDAQLSVDGILFVEAPIEFVPEGQEVHRVTSSYTLGSPKSLTKIPTAAPVSYPSSIEGARIIRARTPPGSPHQNRLGGGRPSLGRYSNPLMVIVDGQRKLKLSVDIGEGYEAQDVLVKFKNHKIGIYAQHEETTPWRSVREFSREFDLPEEIEASTLRAVLGKDGKVMIGASGKGNRNHPAILESVLRDMPPDGEHCQIELSF